MSKINVIPFAAGRRTPRGKVAGVKGLVQWIRQTHPRAFAQLQRSQPSLIAQAAQLDGLGDVAAPGMVDRIADTANKLAGAVLPFLQLDAQRKLLKAQVDRAKRGEPPIDTSQITLPATRVEIDAGAGLRAGAGNFGMLAAGALGLGLLAWWMSRRRGR